MHDYLLPVVLAVIGLGGPYLGYRASQYKLRLDAEAARRLQQEQEAISHTLAERQDRVDVLDFYKAELGAERLEKREIATQLAEALRLLTEANATANACATQLATITRQEPPPP